MRPLAQVKKHPLFVVSAIAALVSFASVGLALLLQSGGDESGRAAPGEPARRIVSLMPPITETLFEIGAGDQVIARSDFCDFPPQVQALPACGSALTPNFEKILRLAPDLIIASSGEAVPMDELRALGKTVFLPWLSAADIVASTRELGRLTGHEEEANRLADELAAMLSSPAPLHGPRVLLVIGQDSTGARISFLQKNSLHGRMLEAAGGINAVAEEVVGMPVMSVERVIELDPDVIIVLDNRENRDDAEIRRVLDSWRQLSPLTAVKKGRIGVLSGTHFYGAGRRLLRAVAELRGEIARLSAHGE